MARKLLSFKDHNGKRGKVGDLVHDYHLDRSPMERRKVEAREVLQIWSCGAAGTKLTLRGEHFAITAKYCTIFKEE
ncbi:hypothetical protein D3C76_748670 [compost metagenome]